MDFLYIENLLYDLLKRHAVAECPQECIGYFEAIPEGAGNLRITDVVPCPNISRQPLDSGDISKKFVRRIKELTKKNEKQGFVYGMYHSHPATGFTALSEKDSYIGKMYRRFRHQIIIGVVGKRKKSVKMSFWVYDRKAKLWQEVEVLVKRRIDAQRKR
jgi:proteasome lid subunit RPN8/RPN11